MLPRRSAFLLARQATTPPVVPVVVASQRGLTASAVHRKWFFWRDEEKKDVEPKKAEFKRPERMVPFDEVRTPADLRAPGAEPGTVPTDLEQATGLERLELLGKMQGVDIFDMKPLDASRKGTLDNPVIVKTLGKEQFCGCTGIPADTHMVRWIVLTVEHPRKRCDQCGNVLKMEYIGPPDDPNDHHEHYEEPKTFADYVRPEYRDGM